MMEPWIVDTLEKFTQSMGIDDFKLPQNNVVCFNFEKSGRFFIEFNNENVLLYLARQVDVHEASLLEKAFYVCHYKESLPYAVNVGLKGEDTLVFLIKLPVQEFDFPSLEKALSLLMQLHHNLRKE